MNSQTSSAVQFSEKSALMKKCTTNFAFLTKSAYICIMKVENRRFKLCAWLYNHGHHCVKSYVSRTDDEYRWIWGGALYSYYLDIYKGNRAPLVKVDFFRLLGSILQSRRSRWGTEYKIDRLFDIPEHYVAAEERRVCENRRIFNENRRKI